MIFVYWEVKILQNGNLVIFLAEIFPPCVVVCMHSWVFISSLRLHMVGQSILVHAQYGKFMKFLLNS
jgi:hypothetical protein